jgi:hypothetical protein
MKKLRLYLDTSVFGGCFDDEFIADSTALFEEIILGRFILVISATTLRELQDAPEMIRELVNKIPKNLVDYIGPSDEIDFLRDEYIKSGIVGKNALRDAEHIASATVGKADLIVSWNFKHIVHFEKIRGYHAVNILHGYTAIPIYSPKEVI